MQKTVIVEIFENTFPELTIEKNTFVVWRNLDPYPHTAETNPDSPFYFNAGPLFTGGTSSPVYFGQAGTFPYLCRFHAGMEGTVKVTEVTTGGTGPAHDHGDHGHGSHSHLQHFHGFVTGGRAGKRLFMSHTPVIADDRHRYQVILQGSLVEDAHIASYDALRQSSYTDGKVQTFHDHLSLVDIGAGKITLLPEANLEYYPPSNPAGEPVPGLEEKIPVRIDKVLHFHQFEPDTDYPGGLAYLVYGDMDDVFIDHYITRAPNFHSVAKLANIPDFWTSDKTAGTVEIIVPSKHIFDVSPKFLPRVAYVDNSFHLFWLPPPGIYSPQPQDPLIRRDNSAPVYDVTLTDGKMSRIEISRFLHFDVRLLNNRVVIT